MDCIFYRLMKRTQPSILNELLLKPAENDKAPEVDTLNGLSCRTNLTYTFLAIDKRFSQHFRNVWNIAKGDNDSLVAISAEEEVINHFNSTTLSREAVDNFLLESVQRQLVPVELDETSRRSFFSQQQTDDLPGFSQLERLTTETFYAQLINKTNNLHDSLVFFSGGNAHGPSMSLTYVLHMLKKHFRDFSSLLRFYIVDTSRNSLPWQYRFDALPTLAFFPARRTGQSSILPKELPLTVPNVMAFILSRCQAELRWRIAIASCSDQCIERNRKRLDQLSSALAKDVRSWQTVRPFYSKHGTLIDTLLKKRLLQQRASEHLRKLLNVLEQSREHERSLSDEAKDLLVRDSMFVRWILANRFGAMHDTS
ncbi:thioredoxin domain-containing protein 11-like isoform 1 [Aphelenchoides avenae]|nr:thioredoxin domain-containing protein 11-like isoform 1 [Aphelenchus avenae]